MKFLELSSKYKKIIIYSILCFIAVFLFDKTLAVGIIFIALLTGITFLVFKKIGLGTKTIFALFLIALSIYLGAVLFVYYAHFQPFSGGFGDYSTYDSLARDIAQRVQQGNFFLQGINYENSYSVMVGYIYALTLPKALIGQMFNAWLVALLVIFVYLIVIEIGGSEKGAFLAGLMVSVYPSLLFFGSSLGKDALVALLSSIVLFLILKLLKIFSWRRFLVFYIFLGALIHFRIYIGYAALLTFIICWPLFSNLNLKKRLLYAPVIIIVLGFLPQIFAGQGYYGINFMRAFLNREMITYYRELISIPNPKISPITGFPTYDEPSVPEPSVSIDKPVTNELSTFVDKPVTNEPSASVDEPVTKRGRGSAVMVKTGLENPFTFLRNSLVSFIYASLGPFPWQMRYLRHLFILPELILWYFALFFAIKGIKKPSRYYTFTMLVFSLLVLGSLSVFLANFGITTRVRIPAFISIFCLAPFGINWNSNNKITKIFSKSLDALTKL